MLGMPVDFHEDMDKYLTNKRRKRLFSNIKSKVMNKKAVVSYKAASKFGELKGKLISKVEEIKKKKEEPKKEITQEEIDELVEREGIEREAKERIERIKEEGGWREIKLEELQGKEKGLESLEEEKKKLQEDLVKIQEKEKAEKEKLAMLSEEKEQRGRIESEEGKIKRLELEEEVKILKEKQRIEEDRLVELRKARKREQIEALKGRVMDILFKKRPKREKDMVEEVRKEIRTEAKVKEAERQKAEEGGKPKEDVAKVEEQPKEERTKWVVPNISSALERIFGKPQYHQVKLSTESLNRRLRLEKKEELKVEKQREAKEKEPKKSFFSSFIQIKTAAQIAKEEEERLKREEEQALKDQAEINQMFQQGEGEVKTNISAEEQSINLSTLFPEEQPAKQTQDSEDTIDLGQDYKIKVVKN